MRDELISSFLDRLGARTPTPGGGAAAALHAAQAAALVAMVARYSTGPKYLEQRVRIDNVVATADELRAWAVQLAEDDAAAFGAVADAYGLPKTTPRQREPRSAAIAAALAGAARPPSEVIQVAAGVLGLAEQLVSIGNRNVIADIAAAADAARAAATTARINIEVNLVGVADRQARREFLATVSRVDELVHRADRISADIRRAIALS